MSLADAKTEILMANKKRISPDLAFRVGSEQVRPAPTLKYLGVTIDQARSFRVHITNSTNRAIKIIAALSGLMPNVGPLRCRARKLYFQIMESIAMYGAPVWAKAARRAYNKKLLRNTQKIGLGRVTSAYRTTPVDTLCVISGIIPWELSVEERRRLYDWTETIRRMDEQGLRRSARTTKGDFEEYEGGGWALGSRERMPNVASFEDSRPEEPRETRENARRKWLRKEARSRTMDEWGRKWSDTATGKWTREIIPDPGAWLTKKHRDLDYFVTQVLTGHGVFNKFRKRIGKSDTEDCWFHEGVTDDVAHTMLNCERWIAERNRCFEKLGIDDEGVTMEETLEIATKDEEKWRHFKIMCRDILREKAKIEKQREMEGMDNTTMRMTTQDLESEELHRIRGL